jgi:tetratricopeptide (TPR) repeat protein
MPQEREAPSLTAPGSRRAQGKALSPAQACRTGISLHRQGRLLEAEQVYRAVLQIAPDYAAALHHLGTLCREKGEIEEAVSLLRQALAIDPKSASTHNDLGLALAALGRADEAAGCYAKAIAIEPDLADAHANLGNAVRSLGRHDEAIASFEKALGINPNCAEAHNNLGNALAALQRHAEAIAHYEQAVAIKPTLAEAYFNSGIAFAALKRPEQAIAQYERTIALKPDYADAYAGIGKALAQLGRYAEAICKFEQALALKPGSGETHNSLGNVLAALERYAKAAVHYRRSIEIRPDYGEAHNNLGNVLVKLNCHEEAVAHYRKTLELSPTSYETLNNLGNAMLALKRPEEAIISFQKANDLRPGLAETPHNIGTALAAMERYSDALPHYRSALAARPGFAAASANLGSALLQLNRIDEAIACLERALASDPLLAAARNALGNAYVALGRLADARQAFERAIEREPDRAEFYRSLAYSARLKAGDPRLAAMEKMSRDMQSLAPDQQMELHFALGKVYADLDLPERSFRHLLAGNALKRQQIEYNEAIDLAKLHRTKEVFTPELIGRMQNVGDPSDLPVFIVGMPRSGTTLVEQVLASHPRVFGADEVMDFPRIAANVCEPAGAKVPYPEMLQSVPAHELRRLGALYVASMAARAPVAERITDNLPANFRLVGLIHLALPNAKIIHVRRDPIDTCLSCFSKLFTGQQPFTYDLGELGRYYRAYESLMAHWRAVLPAGLILEVRYEDLVADFEPQARRIVAYCGLEWDERCLQFHRNERPVRTASATQVREPLYRTSVGRWRAYEPWLGPLVEALGRG